MTMPRAVPTLTDGPVRLRALDESDLPGCYEQCVDPESVRWTSVPSPFTLHDAREYCLEIVPAAWADDSMWTFAVEVDGRYAANIALRNLGFGCASIAFGAHPWVRGTGHMHIALRMLLDWGFAAQGVEVVEWTATVGNWASRKAAWRLGFGFVGVLPSWGRHRGELVDKWIAILRRGDPREPHTRWLGTPELQAVGLRLRPLDEPDIPRVVEACADTRTQQWLGRMPSPYDERQARVWFEALREKQASGAGTSWAIADPTTDLLLGAISVFDLTELTECEIGFWMHPDARGHGVMTRAMQAVVDYAFDELGVRVVRAGAAVDNSASRHVIEAAGLRYTGEERLGTEVRDGLADLALYAAVTEERVSERR